MGIYSKRFARLAVYYIRAFTDTWAFLVNETLSPDDILSTDNAFARWKNSVRVNNPLMNMKDFITRDEETKTTTVNFEVEVDELNGENHTALVMVAMDSFLSLLSASNSVQSRSMRIKTEKDPEGNRNGSFTLYVPVDIEPFDLLSNKIGQNGFPVGDTGPFRKWSTINAVKLSSSESNIDVMERLETVDGNVNSEAIRATKHTNRHLDDSEMMRCLSATKKSGKGDTYMVTSDRKANTIRSLENGGAEAENALYQKKKSRRKRDMLSNPYGFADKYVSPKRKKLATDTGRPSSTKKRKLEEDAAPATKPTISSRAKVSSKRNSMAIAASMANRSKYTSSNKFTSILMTPKESSIAYNASSSLRGSQRTKSLISKYVSLFKNNTIKEHKNKTGAIISRWSSPPNKRIVLAGGCLEGSPRGLETVNFTVTCKKSELFVMFSSLQCSIKQWLKISGDIYEKMGGIENVVKMEEISKVLRQRLLSTARTMVMGIRPVAAFKIPPSLNSMASYLTSALPSKEPVESSSPTSSSTVTLGMTNDRYMKIVEVFDFMLAGGVFVNACLNSMFFDVCITTSKEHVGRESTCPVHVDLIRTASECLGHLKRLHNYKASLADDATSSVPSGNIKPLLLNNESQRQYLERKMSTPVETFINESYNFRMKRRFQDCLTKESSDMIVQTMGTKGALNAFINTTTSIRSESIDVMSSEKKRWWSSDTLDHLDSLYGMEESLKYGFVDNDEPVENENGQLQQSLQSDSTPYTTTPASSTSTVASVTASALIVSNLLTDACLAKLTSSNSLPDDIAHT